MALVEVVEETVENRELLEEDDDCDVTVKLDDVDTGELELDLVVVDELWLEVDGQDVPTQEVEIGLS